MLLRLYSRFSSIFHRANTLLLVPFAHVDTCGPQLTSSRRTCTESDREDVIYLWEGFPAEFGIYMNYVQKLGFEETS
ncbi:hypothetical protein K438DRAFT_1861577 [Mycena galopus ATCC 62051]|nr:hypothetical protein K438DRAFT_1861577 [Mycena galopus ATCC 62051]